MKERPILFSTPMVKAILAGNKTMTRRIIPEKIVDAYYDYDDYCNSVMPRDIPCTRAYEKEFFMNRCKWSIGDRLWVKETFAIGDAYYYKADEVEGVLKYKGKWKPSIFMPRRASRITLEVVSVKVEKIQDITKEDAQKEGFEGFKALSSFIDIWKELNGDLSWTANPFVWVIEFKRIDNEM